MSIHKEFMELLFKAFHSDLDYKIDTDNKVIYLTEYTHKENGVKRTFYWDKEAVENVKDFLCDKNKCEYLGNGEYQVDDYRVIYKCGKSQYFM